MKSCWKSCSKRAEKEADQENDSMAPNEITGRGFGVAHTQIAVGSIPPVFRPGDQGVTK